MSSRQILDWLEVTAGPGEESNVLDGRTIQSSVTANTLTLIIMGVPEAVLSKVGSLPDVASMSKDDLTALIKQLYERSCTVFGEKFDEEFQVKKRDMEIHNLEMETSESHGTFKIPKLKKVNKFKPLESEEESK